MLNQHIPRAEGPSARPWLLAALMFPGLSRLSAAFGVKSGVIVPQLNLEYVREFEDDASILTARFAQDGRGADATSFTYQTNVPDSAFFNVEAGVGAVLAHGIQVFLNFRTTVGNDLFTNTGGTIGLRWEL